jgi:hypothetical protein
VDATKEQIASEVVDFFSFFYVVIRAIFNKFIDKTIVYEMDPQPFIVITGWSDHDILELQIVEGPLRAVHYLKDAH